MQGGCHEIFMDFIYCALSVAGYEIEYSGSRYSKDTYNLAKKLQTNFFSLVAMLDNAEVEQEGLILAIDKLEKMFPNTIGSMTPGFLC